jgi:dTDP-4-dehydrorhamnose reductase
VTVRGSGANAGRILLLGRGGQLGWELQRALAPLADVVAVGREAIDLADLARLRARVEAFRPTLIVNAAAYTAVDRAEDDEAAATVVNGTAPGLLAESAARLGVPLVHFSTDYVFDGRGPDGARRPYRETDAVAPINAYGRSKLAGEVAIRQVCGSHMIFRTAWVYANRGRNFLGTMLRLGSERTELAVVADQIGSPTWARVLAEATAQILVAAGWHRSGRATPGVSGVYHLASAGETSWHGFAEAIFAHVAARGAVVPRLAAIMSADYPTRAKRPLWSVLDGTKSAAAFGIALPDWRAGLALCLAER